MLWIPNILLPSNFSLGQVHCRFLQITPRRAALAAVLPPGGQHREGLGGQRGTWLLAAALGTRGGPLSGGGAGRFRAPCPRATPRGGWSPERPAPASPASAVPFSCNNSSMPASGVLVALHPRTSSTQSSGSCAAPSFLMQIPVQTQLWVHQARSPEFAAHNRYEVYPNRWLKPVAAKNANSEEKVINQSFKV